MTTNYEHIVEGGIDALLDTFTNRFYEYSCEMCAFAETKECVNFDNDHVCREGSRRWLEAEYKEPDSFEKLLDWLDNSVSEYDGEERGYLHTRAFIASQYRDIAARIRALLKEEQ